MKIISAFLIAAFALTLFSCGRSNKEIIELIEKQQRFNDSAIAANQAALMSIKADFGQREKVIIDSMETQNILAFIKTRNEEETDEQNTDQYTNQNIQQNLNDQVEKWDKINQQEQNLERLRRLMDDNLRTLEQMRQWQHR